MACRFGLGVFLLAGSFLAAPHAWPQQAAKSQRSSIEGQWGGSVRQVGEPKPYTVNLVITATAGTTDYPSLGCAGTLTRVGEAEGYTFFIETITKGSFAQGGRCINGSITLVSAGTGKLAWGWVGTYQGAVFVASSTLARR